MRNKDGQPSPGNAVPVEAFCEDARDLSIEAFEERHGTCFLMVTATGVSDPSGTSTTQLLFGEVEDDPASRTANLATVIYPLRQRDASKGHLVTLGREGRNDVVVPDQSVSRLHAFGKVAENSGFLIQDAGSTNGTSVNGASVPPRGAGRPIPVKPGDTLRLGQVEFTFTDARALQQFAVKTAG